MASTHQPKQHLKEILLRIPVLKLPATKLRPSLEAVANSTHQLRTEIVQAIIDTVYPDFDEKRAFRALVAPTLTRLHLARSRPPYFPLAPNGRVWKRLDMNGRERFMAQVIFDFSRVRLQLPDEFLPSKGSLRDAARELGPTMVDRVRGLDVLLRYYYLIQDTTKSNPTSGIMEKITLDKDELVDLVKASIPPARITAIDEARFAVMNTILSRGKTVSSFVADEWLKVAIRNGMLLASRAAFATIESLTMEGYAINTVTSRKET